MRLKRLLIVFVVLSVTIQTGCWNSREIDSLAITVGTGIDKTEDGYLLTQQVINPEAVASKNVVNKAPVILYTETGEDLFEIKRRLTTKCSREIYNSHLKLVVIGEDMAREGISDIVDFFARGHEYRTDFFFVVAKGTTASDVLSVLTSLSPIPAISVYNSLKASEDNWAHAKTIRIVELINSIVAEGKNPVLTGVEITGGDTNSNSIEVLRKSDAVKKLQYTALGILREDKLVGWMDEDEGKGYNYIMGEVKNTVGRVYYENIKITCEAFDVKSRLEVSLINNKPIIKVEIKIKQNIGEVEGQFDVLNEENREIINRITEERIKLFCEGAIKKAQDEFESDIFGFGEVIHRKYPKLWEKLKDDWDKKFSELQVEIEVKVETKQLGQITKPMFLKENG